MGMDTGGISTTDNLPETTEKLGYPVAHLFLTNIIKLSVLKNRSIGNPNISIVSG
jgi:hypothetical protein